MSDKNEEVESLSNIIRKIRTARGKKQEEVAAATNMSLRTFCKKESNPDMFTVAELKKMAEFLEVNEEDFFKSELTITVS